LGSRLWALGSGLSALGLSDRTRGAESRKPKAESRFQRAMISTLLTVPGDDDIVVGDGYRGGSTCLKSPGFLAS
jgi:hypothetical protein